METDILSGLNAKQKEAVQYTEGPLLILAGAGSGKTRVLTHRIGWILERELARPWQILAITFTNKAAGEMRERVDRLLPGMGQDVFVSTFHSMCVRMLRRDIDRLGYERDFTIYDTDDQKTLMRQVLKDKEMDPKQFRERAVLSFISSKKNEMLTAEDFLDLASDYQEKKYAEIWKEYELRLKRNNALDFDDLLLLTVELFQEFPEVLRSWQDRFIYIMVDEYQDTNRVQFEIVRLLSDKYKNLCVVGDDDQSIYRFRGADIGNILSFEKTFRTARVIKLEQNYRSTKAILHAANEVIRHNRGRKEKTLWTENEQGKKPVFREYQTAAEEAEGIIRQVSESAVPLKDQAVLYRTNAQSRLLEERCIAHSIPYVLVGGVNFYQRKEIKDILSYLRVIANGVDDLACARIINVPRRGIGDTTIGRTADYAASAGISLYDALCRPEEIPGLNRGTVTKISGFTDLIEDLRDKTRQGAFSLKELIEAVRDQSGYLEEIRKEEPTVTQTRMENIEELISKAADYENSFRKNESREIPDEETGPAGTTSNTDGENGLSLLGSFLEEVSLVADIDRTSDTDDVLTMMTLHGAKGLEFDRVFLCGMEEGLFPSYASITAEDPESEVEEERRLCYVGMTRARKELYMSSAGERMTNGETRYAVPSRFVDELPPDGAEFHRRKKTARSWENDAGSYDSFSGYRNGFSSGSGSRSWQRSGGHGASGTSYGSPSFGDTAGTSYGQKHSSVEAAGKKPGLSVSKNDAYAKGGTIRKEKPVYEVGSRVSHIKFGEGTVKEISEEPKDYKVTVDFDSFGTKIMYAGFAKLELL